MIIKPVEIDDAPAILALLELDYRCEAEMYGSRYIASPPRTSDEMQAVLSRGFWLKAVAEGRIVGAASVVEESDSCRIERLIIHPDFERRGVGVALVRTIEATFGTAAHFETVTGHKTKLKIRLFKRLGYKTLRVDNVAGEMKLVFLEKTAGLSSKPG